MGVFQYIPVAVVLTGLIIVSNQNGYHQLTGTWKNWDLQQKCKPLQFHEPTTESEILNILKVVRAEKQTVKVVGSGHSFSPIALTDGHMISLAKYNSLLWVDDAKQLVCVQAGISLRDLHPHLLARNLTLANTGAISPQSVAGATATGTHGTGLELGIMSTQIVAFTLILADGSVMECSMDKDEACFQAGRVSLGALGVLSTVTIQAVPLTAMKRVEWHTPVENVFSELEGLLQAKRRVQYWWIPNSGQGKLAEFVPLDATPTSIAEAKINRESQYAMRAYLSGAVEMIGFSAAMAAASMVKPLKHVVGNAIVDAFCKTPKVIHSTTDGALHFSEPSGSPVYTEMEAFIDVKDVHAAFIDVAAVQAKYDIMFPSALRFVDADEIWLSPCYQRRSVVFSVSTHRNEPMFESMHKDIFSALEKYSPRPHWGKRHPYNATNLALVYPRWNDFLALRNQLDPEGVFLNSHLKNILGL